MPTNEIRVVICGLGNCSKSLIEGISYYTNHPDEHVEGVMSQDIAGYKISDIKIVGAIDVDKRKVGQRIRHAIYMEPNCAMKIDFGHTQSSIKFANADVVMGHIMDGVADHMTDKSRSVWFEPNWRGENSTPVDVVQYLKDVEADMMINYLPVGSQQAVEFYAMECIHAGVGFVNMMPVFIASTDFWSERFEKAGLPCIGDDIKSQAGATILHRVIAQTLEDRGCIIESTSQHNYGGNTDFANMLDMERLESKKISKTNAVTSCIDPDRRPDANHVVIGPAGFVPYQGDNKTAEIKVSARGWCGAPIDITMQLSVQDSPNSAGIGVDAIRMLKLALDEEYAGSLRAASAYLMKTPYQQLNDSYAKQICMKIANGDISIEESEEFLNEVVEVDW